MFDVAIFTALGWERRAVTEALRAVEPAGRPRTWRGRLADGASCLVVQTGIGPARAAAGGRGVPFAALRAVLDAAGEALPASADVIDEVTGEVGAVRALAAIALRPRLWPAAGRLARQQRAAARRLAAIMAALEMAAIAAPPEVATAAGG